MINAIMVGGEEGCGFCWVYGEWYREWSKEQEYRGARDLGLRTAGGQWIGRVLKVGKVKEGATMG